MRLTGKNIVTFPVTIFPKNFKPHLVPYSRKPVIKNR